MLSYLLIENTDDGEYNATRYDRRTYLSYKNDHITYKIHGPAEVALSKSGVGLPVDGVNCAGLRCLSWPTPVADWPDLT